MKTFVDIFCGGANVGVNVNAGKVICNDNLTYLIDLYNCFLSQPVNDTIAQISVWKDNQERRDLSEGEEGKQAADYLVQNVDTSKYTNGKRGWHEKEYRIYKDNNH